MKQAHSSVCYAIEDETRQCELLREISVLIEGMHMEDTPAYSSSMILQNVNELMGVEDPYAEAKRQSNEEALALVPKVLERIRAAPDKLEAAVRLSVVGNVIDLGIKHQADLEDTMEQAMGDGFTRFDYDGFKAKLAASQRILYVLDNAGEIVFDKILIEGLRAQGKMVVAAVKGAPILNDATMEDAKQVGLDKTVRVIDTGCNFVGVVREKSSEFFLQVLDAADMVIAKGQGNYETLDDIGDRGFFILKAKCDHVARALGVDNGDLVLAQG
jgi:uncharacterized protein with ATP-grasp and redox domains